MGNRQRNPPQITAIVWWIVTAISLLGIFITLLVDTDISSGGVLIVVTCILLAITGVIIAIIYSIRAEKLGRILRGDNLLVHWTYAPDEWQQYAEEEYTRQRASNKTLFIIITIVTTVCGFGYWIFNPSIAQWALIVMAGVIALTGFIAWFTPFYNHRQNKNNQGQAFFTNHAVYINRQLHDFTGLGSNLEKTEIKGDQQQFIEFTYSAPTRSGRQTYQARIPVPQGKEVEARDLVDRYNSQQGTGIMADRNAI
jgi:hypothetical protein